MLLLLIALNSFAYFPEETDYQDAEYLTEEEQIIEWSFAPYHGNYSIDLTVSDESIGGQDYTHSEDLDF